MSTTLNAETSVEDFFKTDHDRLDELFFLFRKFKRSNFLKSIEFLKRFEHGLLQHITLEEKILFPLFEKRSGMIGVGPTVVLRREHEVIKEMVKALCDKFQKKFSQDDKSEESFLFFHSQHQQKEEGVMYPAIDGMLEKWETEDIINKIENTKNMLHKTCFGMIS